MSSIEFREVSRRYARGVAALDRLDMVVPEGQRLAVLGPSGSGKTTLLRLIAGLESPDSGSILLGGSDVRGVPPHRRDVAMVFQNPALYPHLSVFDNLGFGLRARGVSRDQRRERIGAVAEMLGINRLLGRRPAALSGGERQRVALGRAVARRPAILLLDEPFSNLDEPLRVALRGELVALHDRFRPTLVHVTHDQGEALSLGQQLAVLDRGRLMQLDTPRTIYDRPAHRFVASFVGDLGMNLIEVDVLRDEPTLKISTPGGVSSISVPARDLPGDALPPSDGPRRLVMGVRPERVIVSTETLVDSSERYLLLVLPAVVRRVEFQGSIQVVELQIDGQTLRSRVPGSRQFRSEERVVAHLELSHVTWFDTATGQRLELHCQPPPDAIA